MKKLLFVLIVFMLSVNLFSQSNEDSVKIWGWSRDGKVGISEIADDGMGGIRAIVINAINDAVLWERRCAAYDFDQRKLLDEFFRVCRQNGIQIREERPFAPSGTFIRNNGRIINIIINTVIRNGFWGEEIGSYSVIAETGGRRKTILSVNRAEPSILGLQFTGYHISPHEERAIIIIKKSLPPYWSGNIYIGCNLLTGFR